MAALTAALAVGQGFMKYAEGRSQANAYSAQAAQAEANARIAERNRGAASDEAAWQQRRARQQYALVGGQNTAQLGGGGFEQGSGLGAALARANSNAFNTDVSQINQNLAWKDTDLRQEIANEEANAKLYRSAAKSAKTMGLINGLMTTAAGIYGSSMGGKATKITGMPGGFNESYFDNYGLYTNEFGNTGYGALSPTGWNATSDLTNSFSSNMRRWFPQTTQIGEWTPYDSRAFQYGRKKGSLY